jgi:hypothetical protein
LKGAASTPETNARHVANAAALLSWFNEHGTGEGGVGARGLRSLADLWRLGAPSVFAAFGQMVNAQQRGAQRMTWGTIEKRLVSRASRRPLL